MRLGASAARPAPTDPARNSVNANNQTFFPPKRLVSQFVVGTAMPRASTYPVVTHCTVETGTCSC